MADSESSKTVDLKAAISSAMASAGVFQASVFPGWLFMRATTSFGVVWLVSQRSAPLGMNWCGRPLVFWLLPRWRCAGGSSGPDAGLRPPRQFRVATKGRSKLASNFPGEDVCRPSCADNLGGCLRIVLVFRLFFRHCVRKIPPGNVGGRGARSGLI